MILKLTLTSQWFILTALGLKTEEYRKDCKWSRSRLSNKDGFRQYDEIWYYNGGYFGAHFPMCRVEFKGIEFYNEASITPEHGEPLVSGENYFVIGNGKMLDVRNIDIERYALRV